MTFLDTDEFIGSWAGSWSTWLEPGVLHDASAVTLEVRPVAGGRALEMTYEAAVGDDAVEGLALLAPTDAGAAIAWIDTWHTGGMLMILIGSAAAAWIEGAAEYGGGDQVWRWHTRFEIEDDSLTIRHHNEGPGVPKYLGVEAVLHRTG